MFFLNERKKPTLLYRLDEEIIQDVLVDLADTVYGFTNTGIEFSLLNQSMDVILGMHNKEDCSVQFSTEEVIEFVDYFSETNNKPRELFVNNQKIFFLKFNLEILLKMAVEYLSGIERYGGYCAKAEFFINSKQDIIFTGIFADTKNKDFVESYDIGSISVPIGSWGIPYKRVK